MADPLQSMRQVTALLRRRDEAALATLIAETEADRRAIAALDVEARTTRPDPSDLTAAAAHSAWLIFVRRKQAALRQQIAARETAIAQRRATLAKSVGKDEAAATLLAAAKADDHRRRISRAERDGTPGTA